MCAQAPGGVQPFVAGLGRRETEDGCLGTTVGGWQNEKNQGVKWGGMSSGFKTRRLLGALGPDTWMRDVLTPSQSM